MGHLRTWSPGLFSMVTACVVMCAAYEPVLRIQPDAQKAPREYASETVIQKHGWQQYSLRRLLQNTDIGTRSCDNVCQTKQREALVSLYTAWDGPSWTKRANWLSDESISVCEWQGVLCCLNQPVGAVEIQKPDTPDNVTRAEGCQGGINGVLGLNLMSNNLTGSITAVRWEAFSSTLLLLELEDNKLKGNTMKASEAAGSSSDGSSNSSSNVGGGAGLFSLTSLLYLNLGGNQLEGPLDPLLALTNITALVLRSNRLSGSLPEALVTHPTLQFLDLDNNLLNGSLPDATFTAASRLRSLSLSENRLSGTFPKYQQSTGTTTSLTNLDVSGNQLSGPLPLYLSQMLLQQLDASSNAFTGEVAPLLANSWTLMSLKLSNNKLNGSLPQEVRCKRVKALDLSHNSFTGTVPACITELQSIATLLLDGNPNLTGELPEGIGSLSRLTDLDIRNTMMRAKLAGKDGLPPNITLSESTFSDKNVDSLICPIPLLRGTTPIGMEPYYWHFETCRCKPGYKDNVTTASDGTINDMTCIQTGHMSVPWWAILLAVIGTLLLLALLLLLAYRLVPSVVRYRMLLAKRMPPGAGHPAGGCIVTLVLTDVEGSTELWEWDTDLMAAAIDLHDHTLRSQMSKWYGYEVQTEGDAFLMAFHEPADAVGWCITTQLALLNANWDRELFRHHKACIETLDCLQPASNAHSGRISHGGVGAGAGAGGHAPGPSSQATEINTPMGRTALPPGVILGPIPHTVIMNGNGGGNGGCSGISSARGALTPNRISTGGNDDMAVGASAIGGGNGGGGEGAGGAVPAAVETGCYMDMNRPQRPGGELSQNDPRLSGIANAAEFADWTRYTRLGVLYRGLRVRMGVTTGATNEITSHAITQRMEYSGEVYRRVQAVADLPHGGQIFLDTSTFNAIHNILNDLGIRAVHVLTRHKRSENGSRPAFSGVLGSDRPRPPRISTNRKSLSLASAPEGDGPRGFAALYGGGGGGGTNADGEDDACPSGAGVVTAGGSVSGNRLSFATPSRTMSVGRGWVRGGGSGGATPATSLWSAFGSGLGLPSSTYGKGALQHPRLGGVGSEVVGHSNGIQPTLSTVNSLPSHHHNHPTINSTFLLQPNQKLQHGRAAASTTTASTARLCAPTEIGSAGGPSSGGGSGGRPLMVLLPGYNSQQRPASATGMYGGGTGPQLAHVSQESSCKDPEKQNSVAEVRISNTEMDSDPQLEDRSNRGGGGGDTGGVGGGIRKGGNGGVGNALALGTRQGNPIVRRYSADMGSTGGGLVDSASAAVADGCGGGRGEGGAAAAVNSVHISASGGGGGSGGVNVMPNLIAPDVPVSTSDMDSVQYGISLKDSRVGHLREVPTGPVAQASPPTRATAALNTLAREVIQRRSSMAPAISVVNMGVFELRAGGSLEYINITQVLVPGLEERARLGKQLECPRQLTPGYFNAPATAVAPLGVGLRSGLRQRSSFPLVTLVFCSMERFAEMVSVNRDLSLNVMSSYNDCVRRSLLACNGYECQEQEGNYMIAFSRPAEALEWCLMLQELMMEVAWTPSMLRLPSMQEELHPLTGTVLFRGPRVKAGIYQGMPTRVSPHSTTGRADYFGPLVNRAARYCHAAAQGGQVIVSRSLVEEILRELLHGQVLPADSVPTEALPVRLVTALDNSAVVSPHWCMPQDVNVGAGGEGAGSNEGDVEPAGSIMVLPEYPGSNDGGVHGGGTGAISRPRRVRYKSPGQSSAPPPPRRSVGGAASGAVESGRGGACGGAVVRSPNHVDVYPEGIESIGGGHQPSFAFENNSVVPQPSFSTASVNSCSASAVAPTTTTMAVVYDVCDSNDSNSNCGGSSGFTTVEVPLTALINYDISPSSVPRRMRPAVEQALAESRRRAATSRRDQLQARSRIGASFVSPLLSSQPSSRRSITLASPPPTPAVGNGLGVYHSSLYSSAVAANSLASIQCQSARYSSSSTAAPITGSGAPHSMPSILLKPQLSLQGHSSIQTIPTSTSQPQPHQAMAPISQSHHFHRLNQHQQYVIMRGSEPAYLELYPQQQQQLQDELRALEASPSFLSLGHSGGRTAPTIDRPRMYAACSARVQPSLDMQTAMQHQQEYNRTLMGSLSGGGSPNRPLPPLAVRPSLYQPQQGALPSPPQSHPPQLPSLMQPNFPASAPPQSWPSQSPQQQQQQQQQLMRGYVRPSSGNIVPLSVHPSRWYSSRPAPGPEGHPQMLLSLQQSQSQSGRDGGGGGGVSGWAHPLLQSAPTLPSVESVFSHEHSAAFNALWELATDDGVGGGISCGEGLPSGVVGGGLGGLESHTALVGSGLTGPSSAPVTWLGDDKGGAVDRARLPMALRGDPSAAARHRASFLVLDSTPQCLPTLPEMCIRRRVGPFKWLWAHELVVEDLGQFRFKGVAGKHSIMSVATAATSERRMGSRVKKTKGERVEPGRGLLYRIVLQPADLSTGTEQPATLEASYSFGGTTAPHRYIPSIASAPVHTRMAYSSHAAVPSEVSRPPLPLVPPSLPPRLPRDVGTSNSATTQLPVAVMAQSVRAPHGESLSPAPSPRPLQQQVSSPLPPEPPSSIGIVLGGAQVEGGDGCGSVEDTAGRESNRSSGGSAGTSPL